MLLSPRLLLPSVRLFAMPSQPAQESRKWHFSQEKCFLDILCLPEFKPIGGDGDGVMERKDVARWTPLLERFSNENAQLVATASTSTNLQLHCWACLAGSESRLNAAVGPNMGAVGLNRRLKRARLRF
jgi:hypothetical protein